MSQYSGCVASIEHALTNANANASTGAVSAEPWEGTTTGLEFLESQEDELWLGGIPRTWTNPEKAKREEDMGQHRPVVLLVEDDLADQALVRRALSTTKIPIDLQIVTDGEAALDYLYRRGRYSSAARSPRPHLMLLDLNLPKLDGRAVLEGMSELVRLQNIPVVVLTTSNADDDINWTYQLGAKSYIVKPRQAKAFFKIVRDLETYWLKTVALPDVEG